MQRFDMQAELSDIFGHDVDLICLNEADPIIGMQIYKNGNLLNRSGSGLSNYFIKLFEQYIEIKTLRKPMEDDILNRKFGDDSLESR